MNRMTNAALHRPRARRAARAAQLHDHRRRTAVDRDDVRQQRAIVTRWLVTGYLVVSIVAQSPAGKLADLWGFSRVLTLGRTLYGVGALLAALSPALAILAAGRVLMALGGALSIPTVFAQLRRSVPLAKRGRIFGIFGAVMGAAAAAGPVIGGFLTTRFGWHSVFFVNVPVVLLSFLLEPPTRRDDAPARRASPNSISPAARCSGSRCCSSSPRCRVRACSPTLGAVVSLIAFVIRERSAADPVLDVSLFRSTPFAAGGAIVALQNLAMYSMLFLLPFFLGPAAAHPRAREDAAVLHGRDGARLADRRTALRRDRRRIVAFSGAIIATAAPRCSS
jgi:MFS family permease